MTSSKKATGAAEASVNRGGGSVTRAPNPNHAGADGDAGGGGGATQTPVVAKSG